MKQKNISRRKFLGATGCAAMGTMPILSSLLNLGMMNSLAARPALITNDYKALVCIGLYGGNDSFNMLIPCETDKYNEYVQTRASIALDKAANEILPIVTNNGEEYGIHHSMPEMKTLFDEGNLAFIANVGTLVEPIANDAAYPTAIKPRKLGSHLDQFAQWQTSRPEDKDVPGWGGRMADILHSTYNSSNVSMNISLSGYNIFQNGNTMTEYAISSVGNGAVGITNIRTQHSISGYLSLLRNRATDGILGETYSNIFQQTYANQLSNSIEQSTFFGNAIANITPFTVNFSDSNLSQQLKMVAKAIRGQADLGLNRQTFFINVRGWDMHKDLKSIQANLLTTLSEALGEFYAALEEMNMTDNVTTFTISDFGRSLSPNSSSGTDHAWGGNQIVMGGAVNGGEIYGTYPSLELDNNPLNISSRGSIIPTISTDEFFAELAFWFGLSSGDLNDVFPNLYKFYTTGSTGLPIGFMNI